MKKLLVIARHRPSVLVAKGEYIPRYYNPGDVFDEVHLLLTNDDQPRHEDLLSAVGRAKLHIHNLPPPDFRFSLGWSAPFIRRWIRDGLELVREIGPDLIRVHNNFLEAHLAQHIKRRLGTPYVVSIHHSEWQFKGTLKTRLLSLAQARFEASSLQQADAAIAVYQSNYEYALSLGANDQRLIYNMVSVEIPLKKDYALSRPPRLITINQQIPQKNPVNILRALAEIDCEYWLVGNGPERENLARLVDSLGIGDKVKMVEGMPNAELTAMLPSFDLHVSHCDVWGVSKTVLEASLAGLPTLINYHPERRIPEFENEWILRCENSAAGYASAIREALDDRSLRESIGQQAYKKAKKLFSPQVAERQLAELYREKMKTFGGGGSPN